MEKFNISKIEIFLTTTGVNILTCLIVLFIGFKIATFITKKNLIINGEK
jgi:ABC-type spermidine/putrescine transport system permease subunit I